MRMRRGGGHRPPPRSSTTLSCCSGLCSSVPGYVEWQFHLLDHGWPRQFLVLAVVHGVAAYVLGSRTLLALSIFALAAWLEIEPRVRTMFEWSTDISIRAFLAT